MHEYPPVSFLFDVVFLAENLDKEVMESRFQSVIGLSVEMQTESLREGGENRFTHLLPLGTAHESLILKRGFVTDSKMIKWFMDAILNFDIRPMNLMVNLLHVKKDTTETEPMMTWEVINACPKKWSISEFNAEQSQLAIETIELNYSYFKIMRR
jgi:phage tail-like protein